jgi:hypothetical protein
VALIEPAERLETYLLWHEANRTPAREAFVSLARTVFA